LPFQRYRAGQSAERKGVGIIWGLNERFAAYVDSKGKAGEILQLIQNEFPFRRSTIFPTCHSIGTRTRRRGKGGRRAGTREPGDGCAKGLLATVSAAGCFRGYADGLLSARGYEMEALGCGRSSVVHAANKRSWDLAAVKMTFIK
jgi:hypothetical protein